MYNLKEFKEIFDPILNNFIDERVDRFLSKTSDPFIKNFILHSKKLITNGGKRIRPYIAYLAYKSFGGENDKEVLNIVRSLEIFHNFCLVHDDIMDKSSKRHGVQTVHSYVSEKLQEDGRIGDISHVGNSQAILAGDLLLSWSMEIWNEINFEKEKIDKSKKYFYEMIDEVCLGQIIDIDLTTRSFANYSLIEEKMKLKTASYSFIRPLQIGSSLAGINSEIENFCEQLGSLMGLAFQIQDDLLDIIGNPDETRKNPLLDIEEHQHTFFTNYIFTKGTTKQKSHLSEIFGKKIDLGKKDEIQNLFKSSGAIEEGKKIIEENLEKAGSVVLSFNMNEEYKKYFLGLIQIIKDRQN